MLELILGIGLGAYFWFCWSFPKARPVSGGYKADIILPHTDEVELYGHFESANALKVHNM
jgi:hypothetical protein